MSIPNKEFLEDLVSPLPEICRARDIEDAKLLSHSVLHQLRKRGDGPPFLKLKGKIIYPKKALIKWLESRMFGNETMSQSTEKT